MRTLITGLALTCATATALAGFGTETAVELPKGTRHERSVLADFDGDGQDDLWITTSRRKGWLNRSLRIHLRQAGKGPCFKAEPDHQLELPADVVGIQPVDIDGRAGRDVVLLAPTAAYLWRPTAPEEQRFERLFACELLWQLPSERETFFWSPEVRDLDGDGREDVFVPEPNRYRIAFGARESKPDARFDRTQTVRVPDDAELEVSSRLAGRARGRRAREDLRGRFGVGDDSDAGPFLDLNEHTPVPVLVDFDGDGDLDLLAQTPQHVNVWLQSDGAFAAEPRRLATPVEVDRRRRLDVSYSSHARDLDGDGRVDAVILAGNQRSSDVRTQVLVFLHGTGKGDAAKTSEQPLFGPSGRPQQLLVLGGFGGAPDLTDVDGDGLADLVVGSLEVDTLDTIQAAASGSLDAELNVFLNRKGRFSRSPDLQRSVPIAAKGLRGVRDGLTAKFVGDVTGDGIADLLQRSPDGALELRMVRRTSGDLTVIDRPLWTRALDEDTDVAVDTRSGVPELLLTTRGRITHVRFR